MKYSLKNIFKMKPHEFTAKYGHTLRLDPETRKACITIPIADLDELACMQEALLQAISILSQMRECHNKGPDYSTYWISKILLVSYPGNELEGLSEFLEHKNAELC